MTLYRVEIRIGDHDRRILPIFQIDFGTWGRLCVWVSLGQRLR